MSLIAQVEDAMVALIKAQNFGYVIPTVDSYAGQLAEGIEQLAVLIKSFPAVWVAWSHDEKDVSYDTARKSWLISTRFSLLIATRSARGEKFTRHSASAREVGAYQIMEDMRTLFVGQDLGLPIDYFSIEPARTLFNGRVQKNAMALMGLDLRTKYVAKAIPAAEVPWLTTKADYFLGADTFADATDLISMPQ